MHVVLREQRSSDVIQSCQEPFIISPLRAGTVEEGGKDALNGIMRVVFGMSPSRSILGGLPSLVITA